MIKVTRRVRHITLALGTTGALVGVGVVATRALDPTQRSRSLSYFTGSHPTAGMTSGLEALAGLHQKERGAPADALTAPGFPVVWPYTEADLARNLARIPHAKTETSTATGWHINSAVSTYIH